MREGIKTAFSLHEQPTRHQFAEQLLGQQTLGRSVSRWANNTDNLFSSKVTQSLFHHSKSDNSKKAFLSCTFYNRFNTLRFMSTPEHDLANLAVQISSGSGKSAAVPMNVCDHRQKQRIYSEILNSWRRG